MPSLTASKATKVGDAITAELHRANYAELLAIRLEHERRVAKRVAAGWKAEAKDMRREKKRAKRALKAKIAEVKDEEKALRKETKRLNKKNRTLSAKIQDLLEKKNTAEVDAAMAL